MGETTNKACTVFSAAELSDLLGVRVGQPVSTWPSCSWQTDAADLLAFATVIDTIPNMAATAAVRAGTAWGWLPLEGIAPIACGGPSATRQDPAPAH